MKRFTLIAFTTLLLLPACTIIDEPLLTEENITLPGTDELDADIETLAYNYVIIRFPDKTSGDVLINGKPMFDFHNENSVKINNLSPQTHYQVCVRSLTDGVLKSHSFDFTTPDALLYYMGTQEMDLEYDELSIHRISPLPDGDMLEITDYGVRRTDAYGQVKWRTTLTALDFNVSTDGEAMVVNYEMAYRFDLRTGAVKTTVRPTDSEVILYDACVGHDGSMVLVGTRHYQTDSGWCKKYYIGHFDVNGNVISETFEGEAQKNILLSIISNADGGYLAVADLGTVDLAFLTLDGNCKVVHTSTDHYGLRDSYLDLHFVHGCFDDEGNAYFLGRECVFWSYVFVTTMLVKVSSDGEIEWIRRFAGTTTDSQPGFVYFIDGNIHAVFNQPISSYSPSTPHLAIFDKAGNLKLGLNINSEFTLLHMEPVTPLHEYIIYDGYANIFNLRTDGYGGNDFIGFRDTYEE